MKTVNKMVGFATAAELSTDVSEHRTEEQENQHSFLWKAGAGITYCFKYVLWVLDGALFARKSPYLSHGFAPIHSELFSENLKVEGGQIPSDLKGAFMRNGSNPYFDPAGRYHWFDGDGMVHSVMLSGGSATYCNRFVDTARLRQEKAAGYPIFGNFGDMRGFFGVLHTVLDLLKRKIGVVDVSSGSGTGNTSLVFHAGRLLALHEGDAPYWLRVACEGLISTISRITFDGKLRHAFTAHPKVDPVTGEMFAFGWSAEHAPYCWFYRLNSYGEMVSTVEVPMPAPVMMHDFALTENYVIFLDVPLLFQPEAMLKKGTGPFVYDKIRATRFGVLDRYATDSSGIKWFDVPNCMIFHVANAWNSHDGKTVELYVCAFKELSLDKMKAESVDSDPYLNRITLDLETGTANAQRLCPVAGDFPMVPATHVGRQTRYTYIATIDTSQKEIPLFNGIAKVDLTAAGPDTALAGLVLHGTGRWGGEAYFVPKANGKEEDDGYLLTYVYDESKEDSSELVIYSAHTMSSVPVAQVKLPQRVPYGFHSLWVSEDNLKRQMGRGSGMR